MYVMNVKEMFYRWICTTLFSEGELSRGEGGYPSNDCGQARVEGRIQDKTYKIVCKVIIS